MVSVPARARTLFSQVPLSVWRVLAHSMIFGLALSITDILFNFYLASMGYASDVAGLLSTVGRSAGMLLGFPMGLLVDRIGPRRALLTAILAYVASWALLLMAHSLWMLIVCQFLVGGSYILGAIAVTPLLASITHNNQRALAFGWNASATFFVGLIGSVVGGLLPTIAGNLIGSDPQSTAAYRTALLSVLVLGIVAMLPVLRSFPIVVESAASMAAEAARPTLPLRTLTRYALSSLLLGIGGGMILPFQNLFFRHQFTLSDPAVGAVLAWVALGMGLGGLVGAPVAKRIGMRRAAAYLRFGSAPAMVLMLSPSLLLSVIGFFMRGLFVSASFPLNDAIVMQATPLRQRGIATSILNICWAGGWAGAAVISGWVQLTWGFTPIIIATAIAYTFSAWAIVTLPLVESV